MTATQHEILSLIGDHTVHEGNDASRPLVRYWCPSEKRDWCESLRKDVIVDGGGFVSSLRAMERMGWIQRQKASRHSYSITEEGRLVIEQHREKTGFYARV